MSSQRPTGAHPPFEILLNQLIHSALTAPQDDLLGTGHNGRDSIPQHPFLGSIHPPHGKPRDVDHLDSEFTGEKGVQRTMKDVEEVLLNAHHNSPLLDQLKTLTGRLNQQSTSPTEQPNLPTQQDLNPIKKQLFEAYKDNLWDLFQEVCPFIFISMKIFNYIDK